MSDQKPTRALAILAMCHHCMGGYADGKESCTSPKCPLFFWMPYKEGDPDFTWMKYNPKKKGLVTWEESKREIDDDTRAALVERMEKAREARGKTDVDDDESDE